MKKQDLMTWDGALALFPGTDAQMAEALGVTRMTVWKLRHGEHSKLPLDLLGKLAKELRKGTLDGSPAPSRAVLVVAWRAAFEGTDGLRDLLSMPSRGGGK